MPPDPTTRIHLLELLDRRASLLSASAAGHGMPDPDELRAVTDELTALLSAGSPQVRRVDIDEPDDLLARLVEHEPVHPFSTEDPAEDLDDRLAQDRRCFVLEHPALSGHPMNVVWVALRRGVAQRIGEILDPGRTVRDPHAADTAVFYSIWNVEPGLVGVPGGSALLSGAIEAIRVEFPDIVEFVTLSPIPGFRDFWSGSDPLDGTMVAACARYLCSTGPDGRLRDAVARFHMGNGARLIGLNSGADPSTRGLRRSFGLMANYRYSPEDRDLNRDELAAGRPAVSEGVRRLLLSHGSD